ncbi:hypothetical protein SNEBB_005241, partial [Seison nebaliae]
SVTISSICINIERSSFPSLNGFILKFKFGGITTRNLPRRMEV